MTIGPSLTLKRLLIGDDGAFGYLTRDDSGRQVAVTCERTFGDPGAPVVVIPPGTYRCVRGRHTLNGFDYFDTYEVTGVAGHSGLLFHSGNTEQDSKGCILVGKYFDRLGGLLAVLDSRAAFYELMVQLNGADEFQLTVVDVQ